MSVLDEHLAAHRKAVIARETETLRELIAAFDQVKRELRRQILILQKKIKEAIAAGEVISPSWYMRERRLEQLIEQVKTQIQIYGGKAARITAREQEAAIHGEAANTVQTVRILTSGQGSAVSGQQLGSLLPPAVVRDAVGMTGDGSPILEYYAKNLAPKVVELIRKQVIEAAATGTDFSTIANRLEATGQITRTRALMVARTEVNRVRRETARQQLLEHPDLFTGWEWVASKSIRTCPVCLALDGRIFKLEDVFPQHINCRCTLIAVIDGVDRPERLLGSDWFDSLSDADKAEILGREAADEYARGTVTLQDFVGWKNSKEFGRSVYTRSLASIMNRK